jgi:hypothetical protein
MGLTGSIPTDGINLFPFLTVLDVSSNQLLGSLPPFNSKHVTIFQAAMNNLTGTIPTSLLQWRNLHDITVPWNHLNGTNILHDVNKDIKEIVVNNNALQGSIHGNEINKLKSLALLRMAENSIKGELPSELFMFPYLEKILLSNNELTGSIPSTIQMPNLNQVSLDSNMLTGPIPDDLYNCTEMGTLHLHDNQFDGTISTLIGNLVLLKVLSLEKNLLHGAVPTELGLVVGLQQVTMFGNNFTDQVPEDLCNLRTSSLKVLEADCLMKNGIAEIKCSFGCCTTCCNPSGMDCQVYTN